MLRILLLFAVFCLIMSSHCLAHGSFVYVSNYGDGTISQFRENSNGTLTPLNPPAVKAYLRCHSLATDPTGRFLYALSGLQWSHRNCLVSEFRIGLDGKLTPLSPTHISLPDTPYLIAADSQHPFLYVLNYGGAITPFHIRKNGNLAPLLSSQMGIGEWFNYSVALDRQNSVFYPMCQNRVRQITVSRFM